MTWPCVLIVATNEASLMMRRYADADCPARPHGMTCHDARTHIGTAPIVILDSRGTWDVEMEAPRRADPRWPTHCACGYAFQEADSWQLSKNQLYARPDSDVRLTLHEVEAGMMWDAPWYLDMGWVGPDGRSLVVRLPDGADWAIDAPSTRGTRWMRTGTPPLITARPSILSTRYHGWLDAGVLSVDIGGRQY